MNSNGKKVNVKFLKNNRICPDQFVYIYDADRNTLKQIRRKDVLYDRANNKNKVIVILLESPHKYEYKDDGDIGPAKGMTGRLFLKKFCSIIMNSKIFCKLNGKYRIVFMNSIQYQCSQGRNLDEEGKIFRDNCFLKIWNKYNGKENLINRINFLNPSCVINLCTKGKSNLQEIVKAGIYELCTCKKIIYTEGNHPCSWFSNKNAYID